MRPVELEIDGFTSFCHPQTISFEGLGLFVITGPTGSGKTSILDAMTLALYGEVARGARKDVRSLISMRRQAARVRLDFEVAGTRYRVARRYRRGGGQSGTLERFEGAELVPELAGGGVREMNGRLRALVGLDFAGFTRAVLLPQGDFSRFLRGDGDERKGILEKLLDLGRYKEAGKRAGEVARKRKEEADTLEAHLERSSAEVTPERLEQLAREAAAASARSVALERTGQEADRLLDSLARDRDEAGRLHDLEMKLERAGAALDTLEEGRGRLEPRRQTLSLRRRDLDRALAGARAAAREALARLEACMARAGPPEALERLAAAAGARASAAADEDRFSHQLRQVRTLLESLVRDRGEASLRVTRFIDEQAVSREAVEEAVREWAAAREAWQRASTRAETLAAVDRARVALAAAGEVVESAERADGAALTLHQEADAAVAALEHAHVSASLRGHLVAGAPCPVCAQVVHVLPEGDEPTDVAIREARQRAAAAGEERRRAAARLQAARDARVRAAAAVESYAPGEADDGDPPALETASRRVAEAEERRSEAARNEAAAGERLEGERRRLASLEAEARAQTLLATRHGEEIERARARVEAAQTVLADGFPDGVPDSVDAVIQERRESLRAATAAATGARERMDALRADQERLRSEEDTFAREVARVDEDTAVLRGRVEGFADDLGMGEPGGDLASGGATPPQLDLLTPEGPTLRGRIADLTGVAAGRRAERAAAAADALAVLARLVRDAGVGVAGSAPGDPAGALSLARRAAADAAARAAHEHRALEERLASVAETRREIRELRKAATLHHRLWRDLNASHFLDFLLRESVQDLAGAASTELRRISSGRYSLGSEGTEFVVVDHANADETRSVVTLSGGETFLASLALALSLAGAVQDLAGAAAASRLEAIFIDEGFGALDQMTLEVAIEALEQLQQDHRMVGIITHVKELAERIPTGLEVIPGMAGAGSRVVER